MSFVGFCSNSSVSPSSSDPNLYTPSAPGYVCDGPAWPINPGNSAFNGITLSVDEESCRSPWCKTVSFFFFSSKESDCDFQALLIHVVLCPPCSTIRKAGIFSHQVVYDRAEDYLLHLRPFWIFTIWWTLFAALFLATNLRIISFVDVDNPGGQRRNYL